MTDTANTSTPSEQQPAPPKRKKRLLRGFVLSALGVLTVSAGAIGWLVGTESGLRFGLYKIPSWFGVKISSDTLKGTLIEGFEGDKWLIETEGADVKISSFRFDWKPSELTRPSLHITEVVAGDIAIVTKRTPPKEEEPSKGLPDSIDLPVTAYLDHLETGKISVGKRFDKQTVYLDHLHAAYHYDKKEHRLHIKTADTPWSSSTGAVVVGLNKPYVLNTAIYTKGQLEGETLHGTVRLWGSLQDVSTDLLLDSDNVHLSAKSTIHPFADSLNETVGEILIKGSNINPQAFLPTLPKARLNFDATTIPSFTDGVALEGSIDLENDQAGFADENHIPVKRILGEFIVDDKGTVKIEDIGVGLLKDGSIDVSGSIDTAQDQLKLALGINNTGADNFVRQNIAGRLNGSIDVKGETSSPVVNWNLDSGFARTDGMLFFQTDKQLGQRTLRLDKVRLVPQNGGELNAKGSLELFKDRKLQLDIVSKAFNPARIDPQLPQGSVNGNINLTGILAQEKFAGKMQFAPSTLNGVPLSGKADVAYENKHLSRALTDLTLGSNIVKTNGSFGKKGDRLNLNITAPDLSRFGFGLGGLLNARGYISGSFSDGLKTLEADLNGEARNFKVADTVNIRTLDFKLKGSPDTNRPLNADIKGEHIAVSGGAAMIDNVNLLISGTGSHHHIRGNSSMAVDNKRYKLDLDATGGLNKDQTQWKGTVDTLDINGAFNLKLQNRLNLEAGSERVSLSSARWAAMGGSLNLHTFMWEKQTGISSKGNATNLHLQELDNLIGLGKDDKSVKLQLVVAGDWDLRYSRDATGYLKLTQQSGDVVIPYRQQALGLSNLVLDTRFHSGRIDNRLTGKTRYGTLDASVAVSQQFGNAISQAPINGYLKLDIPELDAIRNLLPGGMSAKGALAIDTTVSGNVGEPRLNGTATGKNLYYRDRNTGVILDNGSLSSRFQGRDWVIDSLKFTRKDGSVELKGRVNLTGTTPDVDVNAQFTRYPILDNPNRKLTLSGNSQLLYNPGRGMALNGELKVDSGHFGFQKSSMPGLDDDVVVLGEEKPADTSTATPIEMNLTLDLNDNFRFSGQGLDVLLGGKLTLSARPKESVRAVGTVNIVRGQYKAYGQDLVINKGHISFVGPIASPNLNLRATRKYSPVGAGVEVLGSLDNPRVSLVSNEPMSDKDKLSWLILGRASSGNESDEATVAAAAGAFLAGNINDKIGLLDDFGMTTRRTRNTQTGELNPAEQVITFGKRITNELYLGYEYSVTSANQAVKLIWQINSTLQAISRVGTDSVSGEVRYTIRFD